MSVYNLSTGNIEHPHPSWSSWGDLVHYVKFVNCIDGSIVVVDKFGSCLVGLVDNDKTKPKYRCILPDHLIVINKKQAHFMHMRGIR